MRTRIRVRMAGNDITLRDVIYEYAIEQIERDEDARNLVSMNRIPVMFLSHPKHGVKLLPYFRKDVCILKLFPFPPYHEFRDGRFHTDEGSHFATVEVMNDRKRAIIVTMGDKQEVLADTSADLYRMVRLNIR